MRARDLGRHTLTSCVAAALLAGCGGSQSPIGAPGAMAQTIAIAAPATREAGPLSLASQDLLYITAPDHAYVYSYPNAKKLQVLRGLTADVGGACVDAAGNVYIGVGSRVNVYAHGRTMPTRQLSGVESPLGCSVNLSSGDLAVAALD